MQLQARDPVIIDCVHAWNLLALKSCNIQLTTAGAVTCNLLAGAVTCNLQARKSCMLCATLLLATCNLLARGACHLGGYGPLIVHTYNSPEKAAVHYSVQLTIVMRTKPFPTLVI